MKPSLLSVNKPLSELVDKKLIENFDRADLLPMLFKIKGEDYSLDKYPQMKALYSRVFTPKCMYLCGRQVSKCLPLSQLHKITLANGRPMTKEDLKAGTSVLCVDTTERVTTGIILEVFDSGVKSILKITTRTGRTLYISKEHKLRTLHGYTKGEDLKVGSRVAACRTGGVFDNVTQNPSRVRLTAYMLGDGHFEKGNINSYGFTTGNRAVLSDFMEYAKGCSYRVSSYQANTWRVSFHSKQAVHGWWEADGLLGSTSLTKKIPQWVYELSKEQTISFIEALWATDGMIKGTNGPTISYTSVSESISTGLRLLLLKFGIHSTIHQRRAGYNNKEGERIRCNDAYVLRVEGRLSQQRFVDTFSVPGKPSVAIPKESNSNRDTIPAEINDTLEELFRGVSNKRTGDSLRASGLRVKAKYPLSRSKHLSYLTYAERLGLTTHPAYVKLSNLYYGDLLWDEVESIEEVGQEPCFDIEVAGHHNFLLDGIVSHNSTNLSRSEVLDAIQIPQFQQLFIAPLKDQTLTYSKSVLQEAINTCRTAKLMQTRAFANKYGEGAFDIVNNLTHKTFSNGASIRLSYASTDPDRVRGITADRVDFDEVQDQIFDNVSIIAESLSNSKWGVQRFTGTAKTLDNPIQKFWEESSQSEWAVKCTKGGCGFWNIPDKNHNVLKMIRPSGPCCAACGSPINPRRGQWVHGRPEKFNKFQGFHIPQIVLPAMVEDPKRWLAIVTKVAKLPESIIYTEVLGISTDQGTRLISQSEIDAVSILGPPHTVADKGLHRYVQICIGVDWGIANITSFTSVAVCGITFNGNIECIHGEVWGGLPITEIFKKIAALVGQYQCDFVACDYGAGFHNNQILALEYKLPVTQLFYVSQGQFLNFTERMDIPLWKVDRNTALDTVFDNIKKGRIKFLDPEYSRSYTSHLLNVYEELTEVSAGFVKRKFDRVPDKPDDFLHALTFASLVLYQATGNEVISVVPERTTGQAIASQLIDKELGTEYYDD